MFNWYIVFWWTKICITKGDVNPPGKYYIPVRQNELLSVIVRRLALMKYKMRIQVNAAVKCQGMLTVAHR